MTGRQVVGVMMIAGAIAALPGCAAKYSSLAVPECLPATAELVPIREPDPPRVACANPHRYEVYAVTALDRGGEYPGDTGVDEAAKQRCISLFAGRVGVAPIDLPDGVKMLHLYPSEESWIDDDDREVECLLVFDEDRSGRYSRDTTT